MVAVGEERINWHNSVVLNDMLSEHGSVLGRHVYGYVFARLLLALRVIIGLRYL